MSNKVKFDGYNWLKKRGEYKDEWKRKMDLIESKIKNKIVLDAGCGTGGAINYFSNFCKEIYGIDISRENIEKAKEKYKNKNLFFQVDNVEKISFDESTFDVVYSRWVIEHLKNPKKFIDETYRILKPGGVLILWVPNVKNPIGVLTKMIPFAMQIKIKGMLERKTIEDVEHYKCYYRANSVSRLDQLVKNEFKRGYVERFDTPDYFIYHKILFCIWLLFHKLSDNKLLNWSFSSFYVEYISLKKDES
jgi:ubiquinone/menaquinone biosynthesis C-methylase UbiE